MFGLGGPAACKRRVDASPAAEVRKRRRVISLIPQLQTELNNPRALGPQQRTELRASKRGGISVGQVEIDIVHQVEELGAKLQLLRFVNRNALQHREIPYLQSRPGVIRELAPA